MTSFSLRCRLVRKSLFDLLPASYLEASASTTELEGRSSPDATEVEASGSSYASWQWVIYIMTARGMTNIVPLLYSQPALVLPRSRVSSPISEPALVSWCSSLTAEGAGHDRAKTSPFGATRMSR